MRGSGGGGGGERESERDICSFFSVKQSRTFINPLKSMINSTYSYLISKYELLI